MSRSTDPAVLALVGPSPEAMAGAAAGAAPPPPGSPAAVGRGWLLAIYPRTVLQSRLLEYALARGASGDKGK